MAELSSIMRFRLTGQQIELTRCGQARLIVRSWSLEKRVGVDLASTNIAPGAVLVLDNPEPTSRVYGGVRRFMEWIEMVLCISPRWEAHVKRCSVLFAWWPSLVKRLAASR